MSGSQKPPVHLSADDQEILDRARQYALDLNRHARIEGSQGQLSPTDLALMSRIVMFLRYDIARNMTGDPEYGLTPEQDD